MTKEESKTQDTPKQGTLYIVSTPIGNDEDITLRALRVLKNCDLVVCEEPKIGARMLHKLNLNQKMELLNEQNETSKTLELMSHLESGLNICLVSDCGTPVFADPGLILVKQAIKKDIKIIVVPGATSIMTALVRSGFSLNQFLFAGFLSRLKNERLAQLKRLKDESKTTVLLETPYRLMPMLEAASAIMPNRQVYIGCNLTMPFETHHYGTFLELRDKFGEMKFKGEFVIVFEGSGDTSDEIEYEPEVSRKIIKTSSRNERYSDKPARSGRYNDRDQGHRRSSGWNSDSSGSNRGDRRSGDRDYKRREDSGDYRDKSSGRSSGGPRRNNNFNSGNSWNKTSESKIYGGSLRTDDKPSERKSYNKPDRKEWGKSGQDDFKKGKKKKPFGKSNKDESNYRRKKY